MTDPSEADKEEKKRISKDAPKRDPKHGEEAKKLAEAADEEDGKPKLARDRQPLPRKNAKPKDASSSDSSDKNKDAS